MRAKEHPFVCAHPFTSSEYIYQTDDNSQHTRARACVHVLVLAHAHTHTVVHTAPPSKKNPQTTENEENEGERLSPNSKHSSQDEVLRNLDFLIGKNLSKLQHCCNLR
jgi:hypothetical protein